MKRPIENIQAVENCYPIFEDWLKERAKKGGWMATPTGRDLVDLWYEFVYENMIEVEDTEPLIQDIQEGPDD